MGDTASNQALDHETILAADVKSVRCRELLDALPIPVYMTDAQGCLTYFNEAAVKTSGRSPVLGTDKWCVTWKLFHSDGRPMRHDECSMAIAMKEGRAALGTRTIGERPDGTRFSFRPHPTPLFDAEGDLIGGMNMLLDVTEQSRVDARSAPEETALRASSELHRQTLSLMPAAVYSCDAAGHITFYNERAAKLWGRRPQIGDPNERFCGSERMSLPDGAPLPHDESPMAIALAEGRAFRDTEVGIRRPDGSSVEVSLSIEPIHDEGGRIIGAINVFHDISAIKRVETSLRESEERFRAFIGATSEVVYRMSPDWTEMRYLRGREFITDTFEPSRTWLDTYIHPGDQRQVLESIATAIRTKTPFELEHRVIRLDGTLGWTHSRAVPILDAHGEIVEWFGAASDVTRRKEAEEALRRREAWLAKQREALEIAIADAPLSESLAVLVRMATEHLGQNARAAFYLANDEGTALHHVVGMNDEYARTVDGFPIGADSVACGLAMHSGQAAYTSDVRLEPKWKSWLWMAEKFDYRACWSVPIHTVKGSFVGTMAVYSQQPREATPSDIEVCSLLVHTASVIISRHLESKARKRTEESLRDSEERFRMVADNMAQLAWTCDTLGNVTWYNKRWLEYTGLSFEEMKGWDWSKVQHPDHLERVVATVKRSAETGEPWEETFPLRGADGNYRWFLSRAVPIRNERGDIVRWFGTNTDVTTQREAEEALRDADRRKDEFLATLAHELRNPLAPIRNSLHVLRLTGDGGGTPERVRDMLERQVNHMVRLVDDLMEVSRISRGKIVLRKERVDLGEIVQGAVEVSRPLIEAAGQRITVSVPPEPLILEADPVRLAQVFTNLLNNASKYTDAGGRIWLAVAVEASNAVISIRDTGVGIPTHMQSRIFDLFVQVDRAYDRAQGGLGIGLTLVRSLVSLHGGNIQVKSDGPGRGSEFVVRLPLAIGLPKAGDRRQGNGRPTGVGTQRVLVVDDNRDAADSLGILLQFLGADVRIANDGDAALRVLRTYRPSVVLLDIGMPGMDGYEVARRARLQPGGEDLTLIALTGWGQEEDRRRSREAGFDHHLVKPVDLDALQLALETPGRQRKPS